MTLLWPSGVKIMDAVTFNCKDTLCRTQWTFFPLDSEVDDQFICPTCGSDNIGKTEE